MHKCIRLVLLANQLTVTSILLGAEISPPQHLRCEFRVDPLGIDCPAPRLSWWLDDGRRGAAQTAYRILVASSPQTLEKDQADLWDSGEVKGDKSHLVSYDGKALTPHLNCYWKVRVWDQEGKPSSWSKAARWSMGPMGAEGWANAKWIRMPDDVTAPWSAPQGFHSQVARDPDAIKWVQVELEAESAIDRVVLGVCDKGMGFPVRYQIEASADAAFTAPIMLADRTSQDQPNPWPSKQVAIPVSSSVRGRYVRVTATRLKQQGKEYDFRLQRLQVFAKDKDLAADRPVTALDGTDAFGWKKEYLTSVQPDPDAGPIMPVFRREFSVTRPLRRAMLHISGLGHHEALIDGKKVGQNLLDPPWTQYPKSIGYRTHDVTAALATGKHVLGVMLGNGMYNRYGKSGRYQNASPKFGQPCFITLLRLEYADGSIEKVISDEAWRYTRGPVTFSCVFGGEDHDLRRLPENWCKADFDGAAWKTVIPDINPKGTLKWICQEPIQATDRFKPKTMVQNQDGVLIDFGHNCALMPVLRLSGPAGAKISISTSESGIAKPRQSSADGGLHYQCTLAGRGDEEFRPRFMSWGSRSLIVEGATLDGSGATVRILGAEGWALRCSADNVGSFSCSDETVNAIDRIIYWSVHSNFQHVLTDCPHREKMGWLEVSHLMAPSILFRFGAANFYRKIEDDMADIQDKDGFVSTIAPFATYGRGGFGDSPEWGSAFIINPGLSWQFTGDRSPLDQHYEAMKRYVGYLKGRMKDGILAYGLGDWMPIEKTPMPIVATATLYHDLDLMARYARILGQDADAKDFAMQAADVAKAFNAKFWKDDATGFGEGSQCAQAMPLFFGMVDETHRPAALARLIADAKAKGRATGGDIGNRYILTTLAQAGQQELVFASTVSGKGAYMPQGLQAVNGGRTTLAEAWGGGASQNHCMIGHVQEWLHGYLVGIRPDPDAPGLKHFLLEPNPVGNLTWAKAHHDGPYGRISLHWQRQNGQLIVECTVPPNSTATLRLPTTDPNAVREQDKPLSQAAGISSVDSKPTHITLTLAAGTYKMTAAN